MCVTHGCELARYDYLCSTGFVRAKQGEIAAWRNENTVADTSVQPVEEGDCMRKETVPDERNVLCTSIEGIVLSPFFIRIDFLCTFVGME